MKKKNLIIVVMTIVMSLLLVACQANPTDLPVENPTGTEAPSPTDKVDPTEVPDTGDEVVPSPTEPVEPSPTPEPTETPSVSDEPTETPTPTPEPEPEPHEHNYVEKVTKEATCTTTGEMTHTCEICGDSYTEEIKKIDHEYKETVVKPTCTSEGSNKFTCVICGHSYTDTVKALGHNWGKYVYNNDATIEKDGTKTAKCNNSNCTSTDTVPAPGTQKPLTFDGTENHYRWATSKVTVRDFPSSNGNVIGTVNVNDSVYIVDRCIETDYFKIKYGDGYGYVKNNMDLTLTDPNAPEPEPEPTPEPEPEKKYDGYDEFGNGYVLKERFGKTYKFYDVDFPYDHKKIYEVSDTELYVYGMEGEAGMEIAAGALLQERFGTTARFEKTTTILGIYNGKLCGRTDFRMVDN